MADKGPVTVRTRKFLRNSLLARRQMLVEVIHPGRPNVPKAELQEKIAKVRAARFRSVEEWEPPRGAGRVAGGC